jgi:hypothetical protein
MTCNVVSDPVATQGSVRSTVLRWFDVQLMASRGRVTAYLPEEIQKALEQWADEESRSVSSLVTYLLTQAVKERQAQQGKKPEDDRSS